MVKYHDDDVIGHPGFVAQSLRRPSQELARSLGRFNATARPEVEPYEVREGKDAVEILVDCQRWEPEEITITEEKDALLVRGQRRNSRTGETIPGPQFERRFNVPSSANLRDMKKVYGSNGVLQIKVPIL